MATYSIGQIIKLPWAKRAFKGAEAFDDARYDEARTYMCSDFLGKLLSLPNEGEGTNVRVKIEHIYVSSKFYVARVVSVDDPFARVYVRIGMRDAGAKILKISC